jgi:hypothetical protein
VYCNALAAEVLDPLHKYPRHPTSDPHRHGNKNDSVRFGVLTAMLVKIQVFWDLILCHWIGRSKCFKESKCLDFQGHAAQEQLTAQPHSRRHHDILKQQN